MTPPMLFRQPHLALLTALVLMVGESLLAGEIPFRVGERLRYRLSWGFVTAGYATLEVKPGEVINGEPARVFGMTAQTTAFVDRIYKVRDQFDSWVDADMKHSLKYQQQQHEGKHVGDRSVEFDWQGSTAQLTRDGKKRDPIKVPPGTFDPLSAMYALRLRTFKLNDVVEIPVSDGKKCAIGRGTVVREERIKTPAGEFDTVVIEPEMKDVSGVFKKSPGAKIHVWFTKTAPFVPVKVASKVLIGSFVGELISIEAGPPELTPAGTVTPAPPPDAATPKPAPPEPRTP